MTSRRTGHDPDRARARYPWSFRVGLDGLERNLGVWGIVRLTAKESAEEGGDDGLGDDDLVVNRTSLEMEQLHADWLGGKDVGKLVTADAVATDEAFENGITSASIDGAFDVGAIRIPQAQRALPSFGVARLYGCWL